METIKIGFSNIIDLVDLNLPKKLDGNLHLSHLFNLKSLKGCPDTITGEINIMNTPIESLEYFPKNIMGSILIMNTNIYSLDGIQDNVYGSFYCSNNKNIKSLFGAPKYIGGIGYSCVFCSLVSLDYAPKSVNHFSCTRNNITSLSGIENSNIERLYVDKNKLSNLDFIPNSVKYLKCNDNPITILNAPINLLDLEARNINIYVLLKYCLNRNKKLDSISTDYYNFNFNKFIVASNEEKLEIILNSNYDLDYNNYI
jgi:hypothetical protein